MLTGDCELRIREPELRGEDLSVARILERWVKLSDPLSRFDVVRSMAFEQVFCLISEMIETWIRWELTDRHDELPFVCPGPHVEG
jgi:hypothetical protein